MSAWKSVRLRRVARILGGSTPTPAPEHWDGDIPFFTPPDLRPVHGGVVAETGRTLTELGVATGSTPVRAGSVILSKRAPIGYVARLGVDGAFNQGCLVLELDSERADARFLTRLLSVRSEELNVLGRGTTFLELSSSDLASVEVALPPVAEQRTIAEYLDRETARIDTLIEEQQRLVVMLRERRQAVVSGAFANAAPNTRLRHACLDVVDCAHTTPDVDDDGEYEAVRTASVRGGKYRPGNGLRVSEETWNSRNAGGAPAIGDILFTREAPAGEACMVPAVDVCLGQRMVLLRIDSSVCLGQFLLWQIYSDRIQDHFRLSANGSTVGNVRLPVLRSAPIWLPPLSEQRRIVAHLDDQTAKIDTLIAESERFIELSRERRTALITAAVTGQIDVRNEVA